MKRSLMAAVMTLGCAGQGFAQTAQTMPTATNPSDMIALRQASMALLYGTWRGVRLAVEAKQQPINFVQGAYGALAISKMTAAMYPENLGLGRLGLDTIKEDRAGFDKAIAQMIAASESLVKATQANDSSAFAAAVKEMTQSCAACHPRKFAKHWGGD